MFIPHRLQELDLDIMEAFNVKEVEAVELHVACYPERQALWSHLKCSKKLERWGVPVWLTRTLSCCLLVLQPPPGPVALPFRAPNKLEVSHACSHLWCCLLWKNVLAYQAVLLPCGRSLPRISPAASIMWLTKTNVLFTAHLLMWHHAQPYTPAI